MSLLPRDRDRKTQTMASGRHSKVTNRWGTQDRIVLLGREVIGQNHDLDPCTEGCFEPVVGALTNYSLLDRGENGLELPWYGHVICNPPGGLVREFWRRSVYWVTQPEVVSIYWVGFSVEQLCVLADEDPHPLDFASCLLRDRIDFTRHDGVRGNPSHANYVTLLTKNLGLIDTFEKVFVPLGKVTLGDRTGLRE